VAIGSGWIAPAMILTRHRPAPG